MSQEYSQPELNTIDMASLVADTQQLDNEIEVSLSKRKLGFICPNLLINQQPCWDKDYDGIRKMLKKNKKLMLNCTKRPSLKVRTDYVMDVCLSSWCQSCPFIS